MSGANIDVRWDSPASAHVCVRGEFDQRAAANLRQTLEHCSSEVSRLRLDFHAAPSIHDAALATLAGWLMDDWAGSVRMTGLGGHQRRLLGYLRFDSFAGTWFD